MPSANRTSSSGQGSGDGRSSKPPPGLYLTATPIGNLGDITLRALDLLRGVDVIACEDTRVTGKLLRHFGIDTPTIAYHDHNAPRMRPRILARLARGEAVALVSDAGTPLISDPGLKLVQAARTEGHAVTALPGASAVLAALSLAGLATDRFLFAGFLPAKPGARRRALDELVPVPATLVFFESGRRLGQTLDAMAAAFGPREATVARELTKLHEELRSGPLDTLAADYADAPPPKGELVIVVGPPGETRIGAEELDARLRAALDGCSVRDAAQLVADDTGIPRRVVYARALELSKAG